MLNQYPSFQPSKSGLNALILNGEGDILSLFDIIQASGSSTSFWLRPCQTDFKEHPTALLDQFSYLIPQDSYIMY